MEASNTNNDISIHELINQVKTMWNYLLSKWLIILIVGLSGGAIGLALSFIVKPKYSAHMSFVLIEKGGGGGLSSLASSFGFSGLLGGGSSSAFSGDNLLEIIKSRHAVENTLLSKVEYKGKERTLMDVYIEHEELHKKWRRSKNFELRTLEYPVNLERESFTRTQDSVLFSTYTAFTKKRQLTVVRKDKKIGLVNVSFTNTNEQFAKLFVDNLMDNTIDFYTQTRTAQSRDNIDKLEHTADSIKTLYEDALYASTTISQVNINRAIQTAVVPKVKEEYNAQLYGTVYAEVLKNLETLKLELARETPIVQIVDKPRYPLKENKLGKAKGIIFGGFIAGVLIVIYLLAGFYLKNLLKSDQQ